MTETCRIQWSWGAGASLPRSCFLRVFVFFFNWIVAIEFSEDHQTSQHESAFMGKKGIPSWKKVVLSFA